MPVPSFLHCWHADLTLACSEAALSPAERERQARLRTPALRQTYGRAHAFLRAVLSQYSELPANTLAFKADVNGKPMLPEAGLHFNLSYRSNRALLTISDSYPVGADLEPIQPLPDADALVAQLFSLAEQAALQAAAPAGYWPLFYQIWTRKEAYAKALGMGLALPFTAFSVLEPAPNGQVRLRAPAATQLHSFGSGPGYLGAVAALAPQPVAVQHFMYSPTG